MFVSKQVALSFGTPVELTSGVTIDQPTTVLIQSQPNAGGPLWVGSSSAGPFPWEILSFNSSSPAVPGELLVLRIDIEPGDQVWASTNSSATANVLFMGR